MDLVVSSAPVSTGGFCWGGGAAGCCCAEAVAVITANAAAPANVARLRFMYDLRLLGTILREVRRTPAVVPRMVSLLPVDRPRSDSSHAGLDFSPSTYRYTLLGLWTTTSHPASRTECCASSVSSSRSRVSAPSPITPAIAAPPPNGWWPSWADWGARWRPLSRATATRWSGPRARRQRASR